MLGTILRFWKIKQIPFTHDEYSALFRTQYNNFAELIKFGVKPDGHPALIQIFLFYWTKIVGFNTVLVKLPFLIAGILTIYLSYLIAKKFFNVTAALLVAVFVATTEPFIMYSQIARPYILGLLFSLLTVWYWSKIIFDKEATKKQTYFLYILFATLASYTHYFSLYFVALTGISGIFFLKKENAKQYLIANFAVLLLFIPHLSITLAQLKIGGLDWLTIPDSHFIFRYLFYLFHYSYLFLALSIIIVLILFKKPSSTELKKIVLFSTIFLITFVTAYIYSIVKKPILQFSVLFFSASMLIMSFFGLVKELKPSINAVLLAIVATVSITTLTVNRRYFYLFYNSIYEQILKQAQSHDFENNLVIVHSDNPINNYLTKQFNIDTNYFQAEFEQLSKLDSFLQQNYKTKDSVFFGQTADCNPVVFNLIANYFPHIEKQNNYFLGQTYLLTKGKDSRRKILNTGFDSTISQKIKFKTASITDSVYYSLANSYKCNKEPYLLTFENFNIVKSKIQAYDYIDISAKIFSPDSNIDLVLVAELKENDSTVKWNGINIKSFYQKPDKWTNLQNSIMIPKLRKNEAKQIKLKVYFWNRSKSVFYIDDYKIQTRRGNKYIYGIYENIQN